ncbi:MAG TPA: TIGR03435 family protein [Bryobacteraceae bacterium]|nr:TIGR03435 family protein [Bryobacteraceae bacterium]
MNRRFALICAAVTIACYMCVVSESRAQAPIEKKPLAFEVASVKPSMAGTRGSGIRPKPGGQGYVAANVSVSSMMQVMYRITASQIVGGPTWMSSDVWDVEANADHAGNTTDQLHEMFQTLLADRFELRFHREKKDMSAYVLSVDRSGSKLKVSQSKDPYDIPINPGDQPFKSVGTRVPISYLCFYLSQTLRVPVVDQTGLDGFYDFTLEWMPQIDLPPAGQNTPGQFTVESQIKMVEAIQSAMISALRAQLGLKLELRKAAVEVFVIDHVERPSEN